MYYKIFSFLFSIGAAVAFYFLQHALFTQAATYSPGLQHLFLAVIITFFITYALHHRREMQRSTIACYLALIALFFFYPLTVMMLSYSVIIFFQTMQGLHKLADNGMPKCRSSVAVFIVTLLITAFCEYWAFVECQELFSTLNVAPVYTYFLIALVIASTAVYIFANNYDFLEKVAEHVKEKQDYRGLAHQVILMATLFVGVGLMIECWPLTHLTWHNPSFHILILTALAGCVTSISYWRHLQADSASNPKTTADAQSVSVLNIMLLIVHAVIDKMLFITQAIGRGWLAVTQLFLTTGSDILSDVNASGADQGGHHAKGAPSSPEEVVIDHGDEAGEEQQHQQSEEYQQIKPIFMLAAASNTLMAIDFLTHNPMHMMTTRLRLLIMLVLLINMYAYSETLVEIGHDAIEFMPSMPGSTVAPDAASHPN